MNIEYDTQFTLYTFAQREYRNISLKNRKRSKKDERDENLISSLSRKHRQMKFTTATGIKTSRPIFLKLNYLPAGEENQRKLVFPTWKRELNNANAEYRRYRNYSFFPFSTLIGYFSTRTIAHCVQIRDWLTQAGNAWPSYNFYSFAPFALMEGVFNIRRTRRGFVPIRSEENPAVFVMVQKLKVTRDHFTISRSNVPNEHSEVVRNRFEVPK